MWQTTADLYLHSRYSNKFCLSLCGGPGSWCTQALFEPSEHLWQEQGLNLNVNSPLLPSCPRSGAVAERSNPTSKERWLRGCRRAERSYSTFKVRRGGHEEKPPVQGKDQWLRFAGAAVKRHPTSEVRETQVRW